MRVYRYLSGDPCIVASFQERQISVSYSPLFVSHCERKWSDRTDSIARCGQNSWEIGGVCKEPTHGEPTATPSC
jgi:hypothetical protein